MAVYENLSLAAILFCVNAGLMLMVLLDLFPAGILQFQAVVDHGLWFARSNEFIEQESFQTLTWLRIVGGSIFTLGGVLPLVYIVIKASKHLKKSSRKTFVSEEHEIEVTV